MTTIHVGAESVGAEYDVLVGPGLLGRVPQLLGDSVERVMVVHSAAVRPRAEALGALLAQAGHTAYLELVPDAEQAKTVDVATGLWTALGRAGFTRSDAVVGIGGGTVTDLAGFVAATWLRGVRVVQVPTTLLGMVDAAVGGKTGINTPEGKNLVGAFHPPAGVVCDLEVLGTLPERDTVAGLAEVIKCGFVADPAILDLVEDDPIGLGRPGHRHLRELVERSVRVKAGVVGADLRESSLREVLNYGHTFGHAVEQVEGFTMRHGEAVSVGMVFVAELARLAGRLDPAVVDRHRTVLAGVGLPVGYRGDRWPELLAAMRRDKKARGSVLRFVILEDIARPARLEGPDESLLRSAYAAVATS